MATWLTGLDSSALSLFEPVRVSPADDQRFIQAVEFYCIAPGHGPAGLADAAHIDDGAPMNPPELGRIQLLGQVLDGFGDQRLPLCRDHRRIFAVGSKTQNVFNWNETDFIAASRLCA